MQVDAVVLDIDGVLIETSASYDRAIVETVSTITGSSIERQSIQAIKDAGGFNNDWDATEALVLYVLATEVGLEQSVEAFAGNVEKRGGGVAAAVAVLEASLTADRVETVLDGYERSHLRRVFQWAYLGPERYTELEAAPPPEPTPSLTGLIEDEPILIDRVTIEVLQAEYPLGIFTGRPAGEAHIALDRIGLEVPAERRLTMDDDVPGKPDPTGLIRLAEECKATELAFAGDQLDDVRTAVRAGATDSRRKYYGIGVETGGISGSEGVEKFRESGASAVIASINELPDVLAGRRSQWPS